jgi:hypothetical protein
MSTAPAASRALLWRLVDAVVLWAALVIGAVVLFMGWWGTSATPRLSRQVAWLNVGVLGVLIGGVGVVFWLCAGRRAVGRRRLVLLPDVASAAARTVEQPAPQAIPSAMVAADNMTRYHTPGCAFVAGKTVRAASAISHRRAGRSPCGVCQPLGRER